ncbi:UNVERIFIED_CONTAM: hypothetical protein Sangu_2946500 [Sesamum angustifolium]|uniref:Uncharacterized protein n=1 Tax=Sesamum angustifolium TaxID=2727405 RepID=A0AAW2IJX8_9LAMI
MRAPLKIVSAFLDRVVATPDWRLRFSSACVTHLLRWGSDHCPLLQLEPGQNVDWKRLKNYFSSRQCGRELQIVRQYIDFLPSYRGSHTVREEHLFITRGSLRIEGSLRLVFSKNTPVAVKESLAKLLGMQHEERHNKFLGLTTTVGCSKREVFLHAKERVLKSKYFLEMDVFEARVSCLSSATLRGTLEIRPVVVGGSRWQNGSGRGIHIWSDRWLPCPDTFKVLTAPHTLSMDGTVAELFEDGDNGWNVELMSSIFIQEDVDCILSISLPADRGRDVLKWHYEKNGRLLVRSAYQIALWQDINGDQGCSLRSPGDRWQFISKARDPPTVQLFGWRLC